MNNPNEQTRQEPELDDVLAAFDAALTTNEARPRQLAEWITRYPQFQADLTEWAAARHSGYLNAFDGNWEPAGTISGFAVSLIARMVPAAVAPESLVAAAKQEGLSVAQLAARLRIDRMVLRKLENRLIVAATIPETFIESIAAAVHRTSSEIRAYLSRPPQLAAGAQYRATSAPDTEGIKQQAFRDALLTTAELSPEDRAYWLSQIENAE